MCEKLGVDHLIFDGGVVQIPKKVSSICFWLKKNLLQPYKPGRGKGFCVMRDGPKSSRESHDTGLGIIVKNECMGLTGLHDSPARV